ncbi:Hypothetical predicted protein [Paramuricea clavata]|uniref:Uncharacterized protein n=1 Tax=Paramuricea clavata TaxID=317549 RepID=A0A6S7HBS3_PARCT|nr:Hypothetical predicted protein [Paramuricea clavata]
MFRRKVKSVDYAAIHERYQDTALVIYKKQQQELKGRSDKRTSRKQSIRRLPGSLRWSNRGESSNDSAQRRNNDVSAVLSTAHIEDDFRERGDEGVISADNDGEGLEENRLGVQSKVCSVL